MWRLYIQLSTVRVPQGASLMNSGRLWSQVRVKLLVQQKISSLNEVLLWRSKAHLSSFTPWLISYPTWQWKGLGSEVFIFIAHYTIWDWWQLTCVTPTHDDIKNRTELEIVGGRLGFSLKSPEEENTVSEQSSVESSAPVQRWPL